ncbi:hypothetical protein EDB89DRAFT_1910838 [Lactarius sanguifluus]|nr:hypothetical protein EDB89DRAFT_1910838 [Lactarius sanguifluus]
MSLPSSAMLSTVLLLSVVITVASQLVGAACGQAMSLPPTVATSLSSSVASSTVLLLSVVVAVVGQLVGNLRATGVQLGCCLRGIGREVVVGAVVGAVIARCTAVCTTNRPPGPANTGLTVTLTTTMAATTTTPAAAATQVHNQDHNTRNRRIRGEVDHHNSGQGKVDHHNSRQDEVDHHDSGQGDNKQNDDGEVMTTTDSKTMLAATTSPPTRQLGQRAQRISIII